MKIYFAYRSAYLPNSRYIKEFESESVLEWFRNNWEKFYDKEDSDYETFLGTSVYGFPIFEQENNSFPEKPANLDDLLDKISTYIYSNEVEGIEDCIRVNTDDDEIQLAWFVFSEKYKNENPEKVDIWFQKEIPSEYGDKGITINFPSPYITSTNTDCNGYTYFITCPIYDGANLEDMNILKIDGIRLPELMNYLRQNTLEIINKSGYILEEISFLQYLAKQKNSDSINEILTIAATLPTTELPEYSDKSLDELVKIDLHNVPEKSKISIHEHSAEICINSISEYYNYWFFMDDLWIEKNKNLALSLLNFGTNWKI